MIDPLKITSHLLADNPELAEDLFDLIVWTRQAKGAFNLATLDEIEELCYSKTEEGQRRREAYKEARLKVGPKRATQTSGIPA